MPNQDLEHFRSQSAGEESTAAHRRNWDNRGPKKAARPRLFSDFLESDYAAICRAASFGEFIRSDMLSLEGNSVERVLLLTAGSVKITKLGRGREEVILRLAVPGDVLGAVDLFATGRHCTSAQALRACRVRMWNRRAFEDLVERVPVLHQNLAAILSENLRELEDRFREVATDRVGRRVALQILRLLEKIGRPVDVGVEIGLSREELAQMTGTTLFTVSRLMSAWEARGVVRPRRAGVAICDLQLLRAISEDGPPGSSS